MSTPDQTNAEVSDERVREALRKAVQLADIAIDWNLEEVEIDEAMVRTHTLRDEFKTALNREGAAPTENLHIIFDGPPSHESGRFVEVENDAGYSVRAGEWVERPDGLWDLVIPHASPSKRGSRGWRR